MLTQRKLVCPACHARQLGVVEFSSKTTKWRCSKCRHELVRPTTKADRKLLGPPSPRHDVHLVWHRFCKEFMPGGFGSPWSHTGYELSCLVTKWAKRYPRDVQIVGCDDDSFCSSDLVLIQHRSRSGRYMGTSVVYIPQTGSEPLGFFLYPGHQHELASALTRIRQQNKQAFTGPQFR